jgi:hypothetical protein
MNYTVVWTPSAEQDLAAAWLAAATRSAVTASAHAIEQDLQRTPLTVGESRESSISRIAVAAPLSITFDIIVDDKTVFVRAVQLIARSDRCVLLQIIGRFERIFTPKE